MRPAPLTPAQRDANQLAAIRNHIPGITHQHLDGARYLVTISGAWVRTDGHVNHKKRHQREKRRARMS